MYVAMCYIVCTFNFRLRDIETKLYNKFFNCNGEEMLFNPGAKAVTGVECQCTLYILYESLV